MVLADQYAIRFDDVDFTGKIRHSALFRLLQEATWKHTENTGLGFSPLAEKKRAWVLNRIALEFEREPVFGDAIRVHTWHRGARGYRAFRDYEVSAGHQTVVRGASVWLLMDTENRKLVRIPEDVSVSYSVDTRKAMNSDINGVKPDTGFQAGLSQRVVVRPADFDLLGHVNNCIYLDYLDCALASANNGGRTDVRLLKVLYQAEMPYGVSDVTVDLAKTSDGFLFKIESNARPLVAGQIIFQQEGGDG